MKKSALFLAMMLCGLSALDSYAQLTVTGGTEVVSQYVWRGYALVDGSTLQPFLDIAWEDKGLSLSLWGSAALARRDQYQGVDEFDLTLNYAVSAGAHFDVNAGVIVYTFPGQESFTISEQTSPEFYVQVTPHLPLSPELFLAYDANLGGDFYASVGVGQGFALAGQAFSLGVAAGYNNGQFDATSGLSHFDVALSADIALGRVSLSPRAVYVRSFENTENQGNRVYVGVGLGL